VRAKESAICNWTDLLAGREGFAPDLPHSYEASKTSPRPSLFLYRSPIGFAHRFAMKRQPNIIEEKGTVQAPCCSISAIWETYIA
jgi:hypothetical protein